METGSERQPIKTRLKLSFAQCPLLSRGPFVNGPTEGPLKRRHAGKGDRHRDATLFGDSNASATRSQSPFPANVSFLVSTFITSSLNRLFQSVEVFFV